VAEIIPAYIWPEISSVVGARTPRWMTKFKIWMIFFTFIKSNRLYPSASVIYWLMFLILVLMS